MGTPPPAGFHQKLGLFDATMLVAGAMIGSGIFIVSADISRDVGSSGWLLLVWILTGIITIMGALSYAELAAMMPHAGGQYVYLREAYGPLWGFLYGWTAFLVIQTGFIAAVSVAFAKFLGVLVPTLGTNNILWEADLGVERVLPVPWMDAQEWPTFFKRDKFTISAGQFIAVGVTLVLTVINSFGVEAGKLVQNIFTVSKMLGLAMLIVLGLSIAMNADVFNRNFSDPWDGIWATEQFEKVQSIVPAAGLAAAMVVAAAMVGSLFSSDAWNNVTFTAGETRDPRRNLPRSLALGTVMVIGLYIMANVAYLAALPLQGNPVEDKRWTARALQAESNALDNEANAKRAQAAAALAQAEIFKLQAEARALRATGSTGQQGKLKEIEAQIARHKTDIGLAEQMVQTAQRHAEKSRQQVQKLQTEATFARGIDHAKDDRVGTAVLERASPNFGVPFMAVAIMISTFGCVNGLVLMSPRLYYAMAQDGLFFQAVGRLNARGVPATGLVLQGLWAVVLIFSGTYNDLLDYIIFGALLFYVLTVSGIFILRRTKPNAERPYKALGYPVMPAIYVGLCAFIMLDLLVVKPVYSWPSLFIIMTGIPVFILWRLIRPKPRGAT
jgi:amino acid transporter